MKGGNVSNRTDTVSAALPTGHFTVLYILVSFIAMVLIIVPATAVIITIVYKRDLHKYHYWFVANLMVCNIISALTIAPIDIFLSL